MSMYLGDLRDKMLRYAISGIGQYASRKIGEFSRRFTKKSLKQWNDGVVKLASGLVIGMIPQVQESQLLKNLDDYIAGDGFQDLLITFIDKPVDCWAENNTQIRCVNFDNIAGLQVFVNGVAVQFNVSGSPSDFTINLATALAGGEHNLLVVDGNKVKSFSGKIYV